MDPADAGFCRDRGQYRALVVLAVPALVPPQGDIVATAPTQRRPTARRYIVRTTETLSMIIATTSGASASDADVY